MTATALKRVSDRSAQMVAQITPKIVNGQRNPATNPRCLKMKAD
jgi:hypothetical protein